jgi:Kef-type K+ transport system membrane component KefB
VTTVSRFELILLLMAVVLALELVARRIRMPPAAAFILGGIALALIPGTPDVGLDPDLTLAAISLWPYWQSGGACSITCLNGLAQKRLLTLSDVVG